MATGNPIYQKRITGIRSRSRSAGLKRRNFLTLFTAIIAVLILTACSTPASSPNKTTSAPASSTAVATAAASTVPGSTTAAVSASTPVPAVTTTVVAAIPSTPAPSPTAGAAPKPASPGGAQAVNASAVLAPKPPGGIPANKTVGLFYKDDKAFSGYTLFAPNKSTITYLIDMDGKLVHTWQSTYSTGQSCYLLADGTLCRTARISTMQGAVGGGVQKIAWDGTMLWDFRYLSDTYVPHHDIRPLPNGNVLMICWDMKSRTEAIAAGRNPATLGAGSFMPEKVVEIKPDGKTGGTVVWQWCLWDHVVQDFDLTKSNFGVVGDHPELVDLNFGGGGDWIHANAVDYNPKLDQIMLSAHNMGELWIIDHSTSTQEAASHNGGTSGKGGDILYRWGNPQTYRAGTASDQKLYAEHNTQWITSGLQGEGNILVFNNGDKRIGGNYSSVEEITPPVDAQGRYALTKGAAYGPTELTWTFKAKPTSDFFAPQISGAQRLPNGNTLICHGPLATFFEVTRAGDIVWEYVNPVAGNAIIAQGGKMPADQSGGTVNGTFRAMRFAASDPLLAGKDLTPGKLIEDNPAAQTSVPAVQPPAGGKGGQAGGGQSPPKP